MGCVMVGALGCASGDMDAASTPPPEASATQVFKRTTAEYLADVLAESATRDRVVDELRRRGPLALTELAPLIGESGAVIAGDAVPEVWLLEPEAGSDSAELVVAYAPAGAETTWTEVAGYRLGGARVTLDARRAPELPVLVIETHGRLALRKAIDEANLTLQRAGLQREIPKTAPLATAVATTRLDAIRLVNDQEPWISGAAEVYAIVSGVIGDNNPQLRVVEMPYLDNDNTTYTPNQIVVDWSSFAFQAANIQLFEHDDNTNLQDLVQVVVSAIGAVGSLAGFPVILAITEIANRIIAAMPASLFTNDDDFVDTFYTVEKTRTYSGLIGAGRNATVSLTPFLLQPN